MGGRARCVEKAIGRIGAAAGEHHGLVYGLGQEVEPVFMVLLGFV